MKPTRKKVNVIVQGTAVKVSSRCLDCEREKKWSSSTILHTENNGKNEKLYKSNVDVVHATLTSSYGYGVLPSLNMSETESTFQAIAPIAKALGLAFFSSSAFHRLKRIYFIPALSIVYEREMHRVQEHAGEILRKVSPHLPLSHPLFISILLVALSVLSTSFPGREAVSVWRCDV